MPGSGGDDDHTPTEPTKRSSGSLPIFRRTVDEALELLRVHGKRDDRDSELYEEGRELRAILTSWDTVQPQGEERALVVERVMDLYRNVCAYTAGVVD